MPVMDGFEATREIVKMTGNNILLHTKIVALSAYVGDTQKKESLKAGMKTFSNPFK